MENPAENVSTEDTSLATSSPWRNIALGAAALIILGLGAWWMWGGSSSQHPFPLQPGERVASWELEGSHNDDGELEAGARAEIARLEGMLGKGEEPDYILYVGIANQHHLLGDGKKEYEYLGRALTEDADKTGLAWHNMGQLLARLGALESAKVAFENAIQAESHIIQYHRAYIDFLRWYMPEDTEALTAAQETLSASPEESNFE
ncbi:hypothetical protein C4556_03075 [Candidatus Parcubacteria bacterium]|nr:MAG: hypothetical protein C4556_03075 [Candidatus Parcubacteria bacterium]